MSITSYLHVLKFHVFICLVSSYVGMSPERFDLLVDLMQEQSKRFEIRIQDRSRLLQLKIGRKQHRSFLEFCLFQACLPQICLFLSGDIPFARYCLCQKVPLLFLYAGWKTLCYEKNNRSHILQNIRKNGEGRTHHIWERNLTYRVAHKNVPIFLWQ